MTQYARHQVYLAVADAARLRRHPIRLRHSVPDDGRRGAGSYI
jgi:hypothetical protein